MTGLVELSPDEYHLQNAQPDFHVGISLPAAFLLLNLSKDPINRVHSRRCGDIMMVIPLNVVAYRASGRGIKTHRMAYRPAFGRASMLFDVDRDTAT